MLTHIAQRTHKSYPFSHLIRHCFLLLLASSLLVSTLAAQKDKDTPALELGKPIERELAGDAAHSYRIALAANQFLQVVVEQKGIDVVVALFAPDGKKLAEVDSPNGKVGQEPLSVVAETAGRYRLEVRSPDAKAEAGRYEVKIKELRAATEQDRRHIAAQLAALQTYGEAEHLRIQGNAESLRKAIDKYQESLPLWRTAQERGREAATLNQLSIVYGSLGEMQKALDLLSQAVPVWRAIGDQSGEAATLLNLSFIYDSLGEKRKALDFYNQALPLFRAVGDRAGEAVTLNNIAGVYSSIGEKQQALDFYNQALQLRRAVGDRAGEATTLNNIGVVYISLGEKQKALDFYNQALSLYRVVGDRGGEANTLYRIASFERDRNNLNEARTGIEATFTIVESLRTKIVSQELRSSYFAGIQNYYDLYIDILMSLHRSRPSEGYDVMALQASERARARSLLETLAEANADIRQGVDPKLVERERFVQQQLNARAQRQMQLLRGPHTDEQAQTIAKEIESLTTEFQQVKAQIRQSSPRYAALTQPQPLTLKEIQTQVLDQDTLLLEYSLGTDRSYLWAVTPTSITSYELPKREEIEKAARRFNELITVSPQRASVAPEKRETGEASQLHDGTQLKQAASQLSRMLLAPVAPLLSKKRLLIVSDGALQYVPFAALPAPTGGVSRGAITPLVVKHEIVNLPSSSTVAVLRREMGARQPAPKTLAVLADPVFERSDERFKAQVGKTEASDPGLNARADEGLGRSVVAATSARQSGVADAGLRIRRLPGTRREAEAIVKLVPPTNYKKALDFAANRLTATSPDLGQYRYVHFATHGFLNSQHPELSGIVLSMFDEQGASQDGFLRAHEVFNLKLNADVVVLSACRTGLGKEIRGEGLVGLTRGFMYAGSPRVVVSLWNVNDAATAELMTRFYRGMVVNKLRPAKALQAAQVSMLNERRYSVPFYWAAFTLQGEWR